VNFVIIGGGKTLENTKEVRQRVLPGTRTEWLMRKDMKETDFFLLLVINRLHRRISLWYFCTCIVLWSNSLPQWLFLAPPSITVLVGFIVLFSYILVTSIKHTHF
jgi:hypothetical protein